MKNKTKSQIDRCGEIRVKLTRIQYDTSLKSKNPQKRNAECTQRMASNVPFFGHSEKEALLKYKNLIRHIVK